VSLLTRATLFGCSGIGLTVLIYVESTLIVVINALRLLENKRAECAGGVHPGQDQLQGGKGMRPKP